MVPFFQAMSVAANQQSNARTNISP